MGCVQEGPREPVSLPEHFPPTRLKLTPPPPKASGLPLPTAAFRSRFSDLFIQGEIAPVGDVRHRSPPRLGRHPRLSTTLTRVPASEFLYEEEADSCWRCATPATSPYSRVGEVGVNPPPLPVSLPTSFYTRSKADSCWQCAQPILTSERLLSSCPYPCSCLRVFQTRGKADPCLEMLRRRTSC